LPPGQACCILNKRPLVRDTRVKPTTFSLLLLVSEEAEAPLYHSSLTLVRMGPNKTRATNPSRGKSTATALVKNQVRGTSTALLRKSPSAALTCIHSNAVLPVLNARKVLAWTHSMYLTLLAPGPDDCSIVHATLPASSILLRLHPALQSIASYSMAHKPFCVHAPI